MKGTFRIGGAAVFGVLIILAAFYMRGQIDASEEGRVVVAPAPERTAIKSLDANGDGVPDWQEELEAQVFETLKTPTTTLASDSVSYESPSTLTGRFSEAFFEDYLTAKIEGEDFSDPSAFLEGAVKAIDGSARSKRFTRLDINVARGLDADLSAYGNALALAILRHSIENANEMTLLYQALATRDAKFLEQLAPIRTAYERMIGEALLLPVPEAVADSHVALMNAFEAIRTDIAAMELAFNDPLYAIARIRVYEDDVRALGESLEKAAEILKQNDVDYERSEPGAFFYDFGL